jgi:putative MATE family efflux protein
LIFTYGYNYIAFVLRAMGDSKATLYCLAVASILNLILDWILVPQSGVIGAAMATVLSQCVCFLFSYFYMARNYKFFALENIKICLDREKARQCIALGLPSIMQQCSVSLGQGAMQRLVNQYGNVTMAAYTVGSKMERYSTVPVLAVQQGMSTFTGQNMGAGQEERVRKTLWDSEIMILILTSVLCIPIAVFAKTLVGLFGVSGEILRQAIEYVQFCMPWCTWIFGVYLVCAGVLQGAGDVKYTTFISLSSLVVRALVAYIGAFYFDAKYPIIWQSILIAYVWSLVFVVIRYFGGRWKKKSEAIMK